MIDTWAVNIEGRVQGVGFRPFIYRLARKADFSGFVRNTPVGVEIVANANERSIIRFIEEIRKEAPAIARLAKIHYRPVSDQLMDGFHIATSADTEVPRLELTPDFAVCKKCSEEVLDDSNRRLGYAFTTCTYCGPRYSIIDNLPYDRERTAMSEFLMCSQCKEEYEDPDDRRFHSQTNSCQDCGISLKLTIPGQDGAIADDDVTSQVTSLWEKGNIVAIKGLSGYLLTCDLSHHKALRELRQLKQRPEKPFAIMCPGQEFVRKNFFLNSPEEAELSNEVAPIVLLKPREAVQWPIDLINPGLSKIGVMIPYTPLFLLLLERYGLPIVATSANITHSPICYRDPDAAGQFGDKVKAVLSYNREIIMPQDDSVIQFTPFNDQRIVLRRSRGLAPSGISLNLNNSLEDIAICAIGADLKSSFGFYNRGKFYLSQYLGNLGHFDCQLRLRMVMEHFFRIFKRQPEVMLADNHPAYFSSRIAKEYGDSLDIPVKHFQHHKAHFAAVLCENEVPEETTVLGVCWDGTGYGDDRHIWGGEFFLRTERDIVRVNHLAYFDHLAGDKMSLEPRLSAFSLSHDTGEAKNIVKKKFTEIEWDNYEKLKSNNTLKTSSAGRLFDAVASLLGLCDYNSYEGQAAMLLEESATRFARSKGLDQEYVYAIEVISQQDIGLRNLFNGIISDLPVLSVEEIAFKFHLSMVRLIDQVAESQFVTDLAFSGGVFQNGLLVDLLIHHLGKKYTLYFHRQLSPNDENIALGQLALYLRTRN